MNRFLISALSLLVFVYGCGNDPRDHVLKVASGIEFKNDAEAIYDSWVNNESIKKIENAHSGTRVSELDSTSEFSYSIGFKKSLGAISENEIGSVIVSAWIYIDSIPTPFKGLSFVASVNDGPKTIYYKGAEVEDSIKQSKKWFFVSKEIPMKFDQEKQNIFTGYVLNHTKTKVLVDDLTLRFIAK